MLHRLGRPRGLHRTRQRVHIGHVHEHGHAIGVLRVDERPDVGDAQRPEELLALRRGEPVLACPSRRDGR